MQELQYNDDKFRALMEQFDQYEDPDEAEDKKWPQIDLLTPHKDKYNLYKQKVAEEERNDTWSLKNCTKLL